MTARALLLDCDGVLADTERDGHRVAFNRMFAEVGLPLHWDDREYAQLVRIGGGKERLASAITEEMLVSLGLPPGPEALSEQLAGWHEVKSRHYRELVDSGALHARPGIARLVGEAISAGWAVAVVSTSAPESVAAVTAQVFGPKLAGQLGHYAGDVVPAKKPAPDIYLYALADLAVPAAETIAIEDSGIGCRAAVAAGITTIVTVSAYTGADGFPGAAVVLSSLGNDAEPARVLANPHQLQLRAQLGLSDLSVIARAAGAR